MKKGNHCAGCAIEKKSSGFIQIKQPRDYDSIRLLIQGDTPSQDALDTQNPWAGKLSTMLGWIWLGAAGLKKEETIYDFTLRCRPEGKKPYPVKEDKKSAESHCLGYSRLADVPSSIPLLCMGSEAMSANMGHSSIGDYHGSIENIRGRVIGATYHPGSVVKNPNLLPLVIRETTNLLDAARNPSLLDRPKIEKGPLPYREGQDCVVDLEWEYDHKTGISGKNTIVGLSYLDGVGRSTYEVDEGLQVIRRHIEAGNRIIGHNIINADLPRIEADPRSYGPAHVVDTMIVAHLLHAHWAELGLFGLGDMVKYYMPTTDWKLDKGDPLAYNARDCAYNMRLWTAMQDDLTLTDQWHLVEKQQRLQFLTSVMARKGIRVDSEGIREYDKSFVEKRKEIAAGFPFNPQSPKQIIAFADSLGIKLGATDHATLTGVAHKHPLLADLVQFKDEGKSLRTWYSKEDEERGRIHPHFKVTGTSVARFSCAGPNAQNIPPHLRRFILPDDDESILVSFDGKNIEGRTVAYCADDRVMLADFASGLDIHRLVASRIVGKSFDDVTGEERQAGKRTVHASNYLEKEYNLAERLFGNVKHDSIRKAKAFQESYFSAYKRTREWQVEMMDEMDKGNIMLRSPFGRVRMIYALDRHERGKRAAHFMGCSTAADVVNQRALDVLDTLGIMPLLVVHDELVYSLPKGYEGTKVMCSIHEILESPIKEMDNFVIPFGIKTGSDYGTLKELQWIS